MKILLKEIRNYNSNAASVLEKADFCTDSEIQSLTRTDLNELFPGPEKLKLRRAIFDIIHKQKPIESLLRELRGFIPDDSIKEALTSGGVLVDYLHLLKDMNNQLSNVESFLQAHISLLEDIKTQPQQKHQPGAGSQSVSSSRQSSLSSYGPSQVTQAVVKYKMVISGKTFDAHLQILDKLKSSAQQLKLVESQNSEDCKIIFVFCPIVSRVGTDVEAAMKLVTGDKPIILVLMHHAHEAKFVPTMGTWDSTSTIVCKVNVFYHEKTKGLITCKENDTAISELKNELLKHEVTAKSSEYLVDIATGHRVPSGNPNFENKTGWAFGGFFTSK